jgi:transcriptional regulator with XRE-family HTH domain
MAQGEERKNVLAERLNHLFETVHPPDRGPYLLREVVDAINAEADENLISAGYLSMLRSGQRTEPSHSRLAAIARFFGVPVEYFSDDATAEKANRQIEIAAALRDSGVRAIALRSAGLSERSLQAILAMVESARQLEDLPDDPPAGSA